MLQPRHYQIEAVKKILKKRQKGVTRQLVSLPTGCHAAGTKILMFDGRLKNVEDVCVGDLLMGPDSTPRTVLSLIRGVDDMYSIEPINGDPFVVNAGHILSLKRILHKSSAGKRRTPNPSEIAGQIINLSLTEYLNKANDFKYAYKLYRVPVEFDTQPVNIDPYFLGVLLGDSSAANGSISAAKHDEAIMNELIMLGLNGVKSCEKFIPDVYKANSRSVRLNVLAGLIDTDGYLRDGGFEFSSKSKQLADDAAFLSRSLGLAAYVSIKRISETDYYSVSISGGCSIIPTRIPHKQAPKRQQKKDVLVTGFHVNPAGRGNYYGFQADGDNLYLMGDFTVTHNCGKTIIFGLVAEALRERTLVLAHRDELLQQAKSKIKLVYPDADIGFLKASEHGGLNCKICIASIQTAVRHTEELALRGYKLLICDEAHHATSNSYKKVFDACGFMSGQADKLLLGVTATAYRGDSTGLGEVFQEIVFERTISTMMKSGYLCDVRCLEVNTGEDISCVHLRTGDFAVNELASVIDIPERNALVADTYLEHGEGRRGVVFGVKVEHALHLAEAFRERGVACEAVYGDMPEEQRRDVLQRYADHELQILTNVGVLTEGWDVPDTDIIMMARPTKSRGLYVQCVGRGLRIAPNKKDCLLIDFVDLAKRHDLCGVGTLAGKEKLHLDKDLTLLETLEREEKYRENQFRAPTYEHIDVFGRSRYAWVSRGEHYVLNLVNSQALFCRQVEGGYEPVFVSGQGAEKLSDDVLPLDYCMGVCEDYVRALDTNGYTMKNAVWRSDMATDKQIKTMISMGIPYREGMTKGEASELLGQALGVGATDKQIYVIKKYGLHKAPELLTKKQATQIISEYYAAKG